MQKPLGPYTPVVRAGDWLIVSGQVGALDGVLAEGVPAQTAQAIENLSAQLATDGGHARRHQEDALLPDRHGRVRNVQRGLHRRVRGQPPGPVHGGRGRAPMGAQVEIEAWAFKPEAG